ncbi:PIN domain-containing protein [Corynebacterium rhinophilum]|uniref:PIN domain-containing protein n=1 Tax=Corynebacterium TaxID=1716 RepID=UPI002550663E|nr:MULTISPECIES: PIN domain-containing protein [unclassified Corynebacterium]MDK8467198.1 PIN domain-containing protein [Corynebacterium sp. MSK130]MDK8491561.1 PIN domain-containing protein [Corynebacterium sp. MSK175]MDK8687670.1 PIN domain-containing protein [Corynebacterium sp. MSK122]MDK8702438.1 PIN domain-containing protein [Corynebacterium sp. MSK107]MDK8704495.1 PIN domain-containing protein [Corynebacterium sp. MSK090]
MSGFTVVYDANVLYPSTLRDILVRLAGSGYFRARWTDKILDEVFRNLKSNRPDLDPTKLARTRTLMCQAVDDCLVTGYEDLIESLSLPDRDDRHVLAAAIRCGAQVIVTENKRDFPKTALMPFDIEAQSADEFCVIKSISTPRGCTKQSPTQPRPLRIRQEPSMMCLIHWQRLEHLRLPSYFAVRLRICFKEIAYKSKIPVLVLHKERALNWDLIITYSGR